MRPVLIPVLLAGWTVGTTVLMAQRAPVVPSPDTTRYALVRELLDASQFSVVVHAGIEASLIPAMRGAQPQFPEVFWTELGARIKDAMPQLAERMVPLCAARFSAAELTELIAFHQSPIGHRWPVEEFGILQRVKPGAAGDSNTRALRTSSDTANYPLARELLDVAHPTTIPTSARMQAADSAVRVAMLQMRARLVPLYAARFTRQELAQLAEFFRRPVGRRWVTEHPFTSPEAQREAHLWSMQIASDVIKSMADRGIPMNE